jgi:hypothetical protein
MVVGDRGLVIRSFSAKLGGVEQKQPTFSILCDKIELGTPKGLLSLLKDDFVDLSLEFIVLPRMGADYISAMTNSDSKTLKSLANLTSWQRVEAQAIRGSISVSGAYSSRIESHYPIRVCSSNNRNLVMANVQGSPLGFTPIVFCNLTTSTIPNGYGLWLRPSGALNYTLVKQSTGNDFWQSNYDRASGSYEVVYNVELNNTQTTIAFGNHPDLWPILPTDNPSVTTTAPSVNTTAPSVTTTTSKAPTSTFANNSDRTTGTRDSFIYNNSSGVVSPHYHLGLFLCFIVFVLQYSAF